MHFGLIKFGWDGNVLQLAQGCDFAKNTR